MVRHPWQTKFRGELIHCRLFAERIKTKRIAATVQ